MSEYKPSILDRRPPIDTGYYSKLLTEVFGVESPVYIPWYLERTYKANPYPNVTKGGAAEGIVSPFKDVKTKSTDVGYDNAPVRFGQKTFGAFWFKGGNYKSYNYKGELVEQKHTDLLMPLASLVSFSRSKKLTTYNGVIEIYQMEKWSISIQGIIFADDLNPVGQQTLEDQKALIQRFHEIAGSIDVEGQLFAERDISRIVTTNLRFDPVQGRPGMIQYSMEAVSDENLILTELL